MLQTKFQTSEASGSEEEDIVVYAMQHNKFQASLSQVVLKKIFEYFSTYF